MSGFDWNWQFALETLPPLLEGLKFTLEATLFGSALAFVLGLAWAIARLAEFPSRVQSARVRGGGLGVAAGDVARGVGLGGSVTG